MTDIHDPIPAKVSDVGLVAERRAWLVEAATELFLRQGFHKTTVRDVAQAADWHMGKLYLYISHKEDILYLISDHIMRGLYEGMLALPPAESAKASLRAASHYLFETTDRMRRQIRLLYQESASLQPEHLDAIKDYELKIREHLAAIINRGVDTGEFRPVNTLLFAHNIIILGAMWALKYWALSQHVDFETYFERQLALLYARLLPPSELPSDGDYAERAARPIAPEREGDPV